MKPLLNCVLTVELTFNIITAENDTKDSASMPAVRKNKTIFKKKQQNKIFFFFTELVLNWWTSVLLCMTSFPLMVSVPDISSLFSD